jgi:hypothetical protein
MRFRPTTSSSTVLDPKNMPLKTLFWGTILVRPIRAWRASKVEEHATSVRERSDTTSSTTASTIPCMPIVIRAVTLLSPASGRSHRRCRALTTALSLQSLSYICRPVPLVASLEPRRIHVAHTAQNLSIQFARPSISSRISPARRRVGAGSSLGVASTALSSMSELCMTTGVRRKKPNQAMERTADRCTLHF